jgi:hypothetical protein
MALIHSILALVFGLTIATAQPLQAQSNTAISAGVTTLRFDPSFESTVYTTGMTLGAVQESIVLQGLFIFPVVEGNIDLDNARGEVTHGGGFHLAGRNLDVTFLNLMLDTTGATSYVTAALVVNKAMVLRIPLFNLQLPPLTLPLDIRSGKIPIFSTSVTLRPEAAEILNQLLSSTTFTDEQPVGISEMTWLPGESGV